MSASTPLRLLLVRRRYLGDLILLDPTLRALRAKYPDAFLGLLTDEGNEAILAAHPALDRIDAIPVRRKGEGFFSYVGRYLKKGRELRSLDYDTCVDLNPGTRTAFLLALAGIKKRIGFAHGNAPFWSRPTIPVERPESFFRERPILEIHAAIVEPLGVVLDPEYVFHISPEARAEADAIAARHFPGSAKPLVVVHPGGRVARRRWPAASFAEVVARLQDQADVLLVSGPGEEALVAEVAALAPGTAVEPPLALPLFAALAARAALFFGNDTGSVHAAAGAGARVAVLFGAQPPEVWRPGGPNPIVLQGPRPCPCPHPGRCVPDDSYRSDCVRLVTVDQALAAIRGALDEIAR